MNAIYYVLHSSQLQVGAHKPYGTPLELVQLPAARRQHLRGLCGQGPQTPPLHLPAKQSLGIAAHVFPIPVKLLFVGTVESLTITAEPTAMIKINNKVKWNIELSRAM